MGRLLMRGCAGCAGCVSNRRARDNLTACLVIISHPPPGTGRKHIQHIQHIQGP